MIHSINTKTPIQVNTDAYFQAFKDDITKFSSLEWKEEDLKGKSYQQWKVMQYYDLMYLLIVLYNEYERLGGKKDWSYFEDKYNLIKLKECLTCDGISLDKALTTFNLDLANVQRGINKMMIEHSFQVFGGPKSISTITFAERLANPYTCINNIETDQVPQDDVELAKYFDTIQDTITNNDHTMFDNE